MSENNERVFIVITSEDVVNIDGSISKEVRLATKTVKPEDAQNIPGLVRTNKKLKKGFLMSFCGKNRFC